MAYQPFELFYAKSSLYIYIKYIWLENEQFIGNIFTRAWAHFFAHS